MLGREVIVRFLECRGVKYIFHLPGIHTLPLNDALTRSNIRVLVGRHEASIAFMADGFSRATGFPGVVLVTPGPGIGNIVSACMEAYADDIPLIILFIEVERNRVVKGTLHGVQGTEMIFANISKGTFVVSDGTDLVTQLDSAYSTATRERQGPVVISVPFRILDRECGFELAEQPLRRESIPSMAPRDGAERAFVEAFFEKALEGSRNPAIVGGKALMESKSAAILGSICSESGIPFLTTTSGKGTLREDMNCVFGNVISKGVTREILTSADVTIALGTRLRDVDARRRGVKIGRLVHVDIDDRWLGKNYESFLEMACDMKTVVETLRSVTEGKRFSWDMIKLQKAREHERSELEQNHEGFRIVRRLREVVPQDAITVWDLNLISYWAEYYFPVFFERSFFSPRGISPIFYALPASIGARLGRGRSPCLCVTGDGSFLASAAELATIRRYDVPVVMLVYNNSSFGVLENYMRKRYGTEGTMNLYNPDLVELAHAFAIEGRRADSLNELERILAEDVRWDRPYLIDFRYPIFAPPWE